MKHYKTNNEIRAIEEGQEFLTQSDWVELTDAELQAELNPPLTLQQIEDAKPKVITMRQTRLALLQANLLQTVDTAIANGTDEAMKIEWEYATEVRRDWASLITMSEALGMTSAELDNLFALGVTL